MREEICLSSSRVNTFPVGFWGVLRRRRRVRGENAAESSSQSKCQEVEEEGEEVEEEGGRRGTWTQVPPAIWI